jgi:LuxR family maltose regulon positive regulatory protein
MVRQQHCAAAEGPEGDHSLSEPPAIVATRLAVPSMPPTFVRRPRLDDRLHAAASRPLTLVSAPAGTGKTVAVAAWVIGCSRAGPVVWVSLDNAVPAPYAVWALVGEGLRGAGVAGAGELPAEPDIRDVVGAVLGSGSTVTLVLDTDRVMAAEEAAGLDYLLRRSGDRLRVVLLTRSDPLLPLHRYRLAGAVEEVRVADLAFTLEETAQLLTGTGVHLSGAGVEDVARRTQGWAAGLVLTAMSLAHHADPEQAARSLAGDEGAIAEYLLNEVLDVQPPRVRELMLRTCVVDVLHPELVEALAGAGAPRALSFLVHGNAFLEAVPGSSGSYRYHPLFRDLLRAQLAYEAPDTAAALHRTAAYWMAERGYMRDALRHCVAAGAWDVAARLVVDDLAIAELVLRGAKEGPGAWMQRMPDDVAGPQASLVRAALALVAGDPATTAAQVSAARRRLTSRPPWPAAEVALHLLEAWHSLICGAGETALAATSAADAVLPRLDPDRRAAHPELVAVLRDVEGAGSVLVGDLRRGRAAFAAAASTARRRGCERPVVDALGHLALIAAWRGQLRRAAEMAEHARTAAGGARRPAEAGPAATALAWVQVETDDLAPAERQLARAGRPAGSDDPLQAVMRSIALARIHRARGEVDAAHAALRMHPDQQGTPGWLVDRLLVEEAAVDVVRGRPQQALGRVAELSEQDLPEAALLANRARLALGAAPGPAPMPGPGPDQPLSTHVEAWLVEAWRQVRRHDDRRALQALGRALRLAAPECLRRPFREAPAEVRDLLRRGDLPVEHPWLDRSPAVRQDGSRVAALAPAGPLEPLTEKEQEVLGHLADLLTTEEIASAMFISVNTVRTHVRNILRKLSASRRNEALRRARALGIIPSRPR